VVTDLELVDRLQTRLEERLPRRAVEQAALG
jgi:hypothetical protein